MNLTLKEWILIHKTLCDKKHAVSEIIAEIAPEIGVAIKKERIWQIFKEADELSLKVFAHIEELRNQGD